MLEVEHPGGRGRMTSESDQNVREAENKRTLSTHRKPSEIELRLLLNVNRKSCANCMDHSVNGTAVRHTRLQGYVKAKCGQF